MQSAHHPDRSGSNPLAGLGAQGRDDLSAATERARGMVAAGRPLRDVLADLVTAAEALADSPAVSSILLIDDEGLLRNGASPNLPADYLVAIDRLKPDPDVGTCAAAAATGQIVLTPSFYDDCRWAELRHLPMALGFVGAWSMPIKSGDGRVLGTFGTYFREHREPSDRERTVVAALSETAAFAIGSDSARARSAS